MIEKVLPWFTYDQCITYCLSNEKCFKCAFFKDKGFCSLFAGLFKYYTPIIKLESLKRSFAQHSIHYDKGCEDCAYCINVHNEDCNFTDFMIKIGKIYAFKHA